MLIAYVPLLFAIAFALLYALVNNPKVAALSLYGWAASWLATMLAVHATFRIG